MTFAVLQLWFWSPEEISGSLSAEQNMRTAACCRQKLNREQEKTSSECLTSPFDEDGFRSRTLPACLQITIAAAANQRANQREVTDRCGTGVREVGDRCYRN